MTNAEKFEEVFGKKISKCAPDPCNIIDYSQGGCLHSECFSCELSDFWDKEYDNKIGEDRADAESIETDEEYSFFEHFLALLLLMVDVENYRKTERREKMTDEQKEAFQAITGEDNINPNHYKSETSLECIEAMQIAFGNEVVIDFCLCNAWKYIWRWKNKNGIEDLKKAEWYVEKGRELLGNNLEFSFSDIHQRFDSMADYINSKKEDNDGL